MYEFEAWGKISKSEMEAIEKIQNQSLKKILHLPVTKPSSGMLMETETWTAKERTEYSNLMLIHNIVNSIKEKISQKIILEQKEGNAKHTARKS